MKNVINLRSVTLFHPFTDRIDEIRLICLKSIKFATSFALQAALMREYLHFSSQRTSFKRLLYFSEPFNKNDYCANVFQSLPLALKIFHWTL